MRVEERLLKYVSYWTTSDEECRQIPSSERQFELGKVLEQELRDLGLEKVTLTDHCYVYGLLPATKGYADKPAVGFISHMDTAPDFSGKDVKPQIIPDYDGNDVLLKGSGAYLKISEGCNRGCSYCAIPIMTGEYKSRPFEEIVDEAERLAKQGVKELLVLAQDITYYGIDKYGKNRLAELVDRIADIPGIEWIKLHYAYPAGFPMELLTVMRERKNVCKYLDIALQHCSDHMLKMMRRGVTKQQTIDLINKIREEVPGIALRTTLMVGHPGETEGDYRELEDFVKTMKFERLGVFPYSHEEDTYCDKHYQDDVPEETKNKRAEKLMALQEGVVAALNESCVGKRFWVLIDRVEGDYFVGRTQYDSPEVDQEVFVTSEKALQIGEFYEVLITEAGQFELYAKCE